MGVVNVTPDSFSDGGQWLDHEVAVAHARHLLAQGADLVDVGGESTRPGAARVPVAEELHRIIPVVAELAAEGARVSVDTMRTEVAAAALDAGAELINDVSGGRADPQMPALIAERGCRYVLSHWRGHSDVMNSLGRYRDVVAEVSAELLAQVAVFRAAGVDPDRIVLDPGLGFAKDAAANWQLLAHIEELTALGHEVLIGASRKRFLGELLAHDGAESLPLFRDRATAAVTALMAERGVWGVRVHEVSASVDAIRVAGALRRAKDGSIA
ncbi:dihydropteroate synthase [Pseudactinotalea sp. HY160]|nr:MULTISPECIES: dihydropteroate synthase [unclassified Pseudactinotalea]MPV48429.1 dihydropteroate synthase [Pseudactinotalea sp. HY160]QGH70885.1 dihydropteroate synthase [Pseudactinotalea sp. HY158]